MPRHDPVQCDDRVEGRVLTGGTYTYINQSRIVS